MAAIDLGNLLSGLIGAILGAIAVVLIYRWDKIDAAISELVELVYVIGYKSWSTPEQGKAGLIFLRYHPKLWSRYTNLRKHIWFWRRRGLDKSWREYIGQEHYDNIPDDLMGKMFFQGIPVNRDDAVTRSEKFIKHLQKLR
jgi:ABC-type transport system involved in cytochrome c biogenesis permease subunit